VHRSPRMKISPAPARRPDMTPVARPEHQRPSAHDGQSSWGPRPQSGRQRCACRPPSCLQRRAHPSRMPMASIPPRKVGALANMSPFHKPSFVRRAPGLTAVLDYLCPG
jgi:hypothetical protein